MSSSASRVARIAKQLAPSETKSEASIAPAPTSGSFSRIGTKSADDVVVRAALSPRQTLSKPTMPHWIPIPPLPPLAAVVASVVENAHSSALCYAHD